MKHHYKTVIIHYWKLAIILSLGALNLAGCALLNMQLGQDGTDYDDDPVAKAAMQVRAPASAPSANPEADLGSELTLGMSMRRVRNLWGEPQDVATAGDTLAGNQRWTYYEGLSSRWAIRSARIVYFEHGRVSGWETSRR